LEVYAVPGKTVSRDESSQEVIRPGAALHAPKRMRMQFNLRWFLLAQALAIILFWLAYLYWPFMLGALMPGVNRAWKKERPTPQRVWVVRLIIVGPSLLVCGAAAATAVRALGRKYEEPAARIALVIVFLICQVAATASAIIIIAPPYLFRPIGIIATKDFCVVFAAPLAVAVAVGAFLGWWLLLNE
jgi:hypothetical protein